MHRREFLLSATGIVGATTVGSIAYTSATVERNVTANVEGDDDGIIELTPGIPAASKNNSGNLSLNLNEDLNKEGTFEYGSWSDPTATPLFTITNKDDQTHDISVDLSSTSGSIRVKLSPPSASDITVNDGGSSGDITLDGTNNTAQSIDVALEIDTSGVATGTDAVDATITINGKPDGQ
ncbi:hypothetical protein [Halorubellus salinus]|uniref:hypothetical protein n=1 Tax=Halorubellus salinus TaxID=755309 RepID=UPI001D06C935|nr:hypothetical protein [Halorubellus salinus]